MKRLPPPPSPSSSDGKEGRVRGRGRWRRQKDKPTDRQTDSGRTDGRTDRRGRKPRRPRSLELSVPRKTTTRRRELPSAAAAAAVRSPQTFSKQSIERTNGLGQAQARAMEAASAVEVREPTAAAAAAMSSPPFHIHHPPRCVTRCSQWQKVGARGVRKRDQMVHCCIHCISWVTLDNLEETPARIRIRPCCSLERAGGRGRGR